NRAMAFRIRAAAYEVVGDDKKCLEALSAAFQIWSRLPNMPAIPGALVRLAFVESKSVRDLRQAKLLGGAVAISEAVQVAFSSRELSLIAKLTSSLNTKFGDDAVEVEIASGQRLEPTTVIALAVAGP